MKYHQIKSMFVLSTVAGVTMFMSSQPAQANEARFSCGQNKGLPTTLAKTKRGLVPVIHWKSKDFEKSGWTPEVRCQKVSRLFEQYYREGTLDYLTTARDKKTRQNVVCVAPAEGAKCTGILFTLRSGSNPGRTLKKLMDLRVRATSDPLNETLERVYVNMDDFLKSSPVVSENSPISPKPSASQPALEDMW